MSALIDTRCHENRAPEEYDGPYVFFARSTTQDEPALDDAVGTTPFREIYDVECISIDLGEAESIAAVVRSGNLFRGTFGIGRVQGVFVRDHKQDYLPRGIASDDALNSATCEVELVGYTE